MNLHELLRYNNIVIQCHDNPDADAIASGFGLWYYFRKNGKSPRLIYGGRNQISKSNLVLMVEKLNIPIEHVEALEKEPELLVTVDCQYGERNVQKLPAGTVAVIDHHVPRLDQLPELREVRDNYGSCATIIWDMLRAEGLPAREVSLATALYYGLFMDTGKMQEIRHPKDKDMRDSLEAELDHGILTLLQNSNLSQEELKIAGKAMYGIDYEERGRFAIAEAQRCDPNILGIISDALIEVDGVGTCISYCVLEDGVKLSVRSCERETRADELAAFVSQGIGSGGGHRGKAGGFLVRERLVEEYGRSYGSALKEQGEDDGSNPELGLIANRILRDRLNEYFRDQDYYFSGSEEVPDLSGEPVYQKRRLRIGYVKATEMYSAGTRVSVRTLEGDLPFVVRDNTYFMIGIEGEVYKNDEEYFLSHNDPTGERYEITGEYAPTIHMAVNSLEMEEEDAKPKELKDYAMACIPKGGSRVYARELKRRTKVFVPWSESYMLGKPGDYLASRVENPNDIYIIARNIMEKSYDRVSRRSDDEI